MKTYRREWCERCHRYNEKYPCPITVAHTLWDIDERDNLASILHKMIPYSPFMTNLSRRNQMCFMFEATRPRKNKKR